MPKDIEDEFMKEVDGIKEGTRAIVVKSILDAFALYKFSLGKGDYSIKVAITEVLSEITADDIEEAIASYLKTVQCVHCQQNMFHKSIAQ